MLLLGIMDMDVAVFTTIPGVGKLGNGKMGGAQRLKGGALTQARKSHRNNPQDRAPNGCSLKVVLASLHLGRTHIKDD